MNLKDNKYNRFSLCREMLETPEVVAKFNEEPISDFAKALSREKNIFLTGEGSSRILPAKRAIYNLLKQGTDLAVSTDGGTQALEYNLKDSIVFGASNSGKTKELIRLFTTLENQGNNNLFGITANKNTPLEDLSAKTHVLTCGKENAVAATKSVVEQSLFYDVLFTGYAGESMGNLSEAGNAIKTALEINIDSKIIEKIVNAGTIYFSGRNDGVAEELTLKTNEITHKKSDFLEGTYGVHGIEEVMNKDDVVIIINPFEDEEEKFKECLIDGVGLNIIAISTRKTIFSTIKIPNVDYFQNYVELAAGWNILVETGISLGIDLDKAERARKVGNEFLG
ncbi:MAG: SIS domain-containing protein [Spirochaetia bacterium]|jgi:glucosamine--fructose-6-phosphate aminotransferase (isomerizing)|nr:SIS domain-containing protein [Spirochaetia bacterium]